MLQPVIDDLLVWAGRRGHQLDVDLLVQALDLRLLHDDLGDNHWPAGSVRQLMVERYPASGPVEPPAAEELLATLEVFWRFLRSDGRMNVRSASPAELVAEGRKARGRMAKACQEAAMVTARRALAEQEQARDRLIPASDVRASAADFRASGLWRQLRALMDWVAAGPEGTRQVLPVGDLEMGQVRELWELLDLGVWTGRFRAADFDADEVPAALASVPVVSRVAWDEGWAVQADCPAVDRLWWVAVRAGLLTVVEGTARGVLDEPSDAQGWVELAMAVLYCTAEWCAYETSLEALCLVLMMTSEPAGGGPATLRELVQAWVDSVRADLLDLGIAETSALDEAGWDLVHGMALFDDANLWRRGHRIEGTALGWDFCTVLSGALDDNGVLGLQE
ncbi:hypothetical protein EDD41_1651 [Luteococcus japonicus]|uniref:Uncharacterized protein n=1 Tax=Luteococcus japonicus TaxID=33984 RepID=A0A3N1ZUB7_9ACTN|nr:hypothetical protein EDD41_1651 [Luteococcus japonicus]